MTQPFSPDSDALERGRLLFTRPCDFVAGAVRAEDLPEAPLPEFAFAGRSNVGKSSLLNALTNRRMLARTSRTPGRTKQLNFFDLGGFVRLVDLPGYGYASASKTDIKSWTALTLDFLQGRAALKRVFLLIDSRRGILPKDREMMEIFDKSAVSWALVLTKMDKVKADDREAVCADALAGAASHVASYPKVYPTSSERSTGLEDLRAHIAAFVD